MINVEIKARCVDQARIRALLMAQGARHVGEDHQVDTYFDVQRGRLKLREGTIERALIYYRRPDELGPKVSDVMLYQPAPGSALKSMLVQSIGVLVVVEKRREIFFIDNVKFHLDRVDRLGTFVEIEAIDEQESIGRERLLAQCRHYLHQFGIEEDDLVAASYSDLLLQQK